MSAVSKVNRLSLIPILFSCFVFIASSAFASTYLPVGDRGYEILQRLEAEGYIKDGILTILPLSRGEVMRLLREAEANSSGMDESNLSLIGELRDIMRSDTVSGDIETANSLYAVYSYDSSDGRKLDYNNEGDLYLKGTNARLGLASSLNMPWFSFYLNPEYRVSGGQDNGVLKQGYAVLDLWGLEVEAGKDSQWWGPGYHGAILLSDNAEPFTMIKLTNSEPVVLPWIFKYLGQVRFSVFATRLEKERNDVPEPYLWGMRVVFKPSQYFEIGLERTAMLGGKGRSESLGTWWRSFTGKGENYDGTGTDKEAGDQKAGGDIKLTLPFDWQPVQLYLEIDGEDEANYMPSKAAYIAGIYLPNLFNSKRFDFRVEYASDKIKHTPGWKDRWYEHHIYTDGYTYHGEIMGHHMGTDSRDLFLELTTLIPERNMKLSLAYDREEHNLTGNIGEKKDEGDLVIDLRVSENVSLNIAYGYGKITDLDNIESKNEEVHQLKGCLSYTF